jgi:hypothetical protein
MSIGLGGLTLPDGWRVRFAPICSTPEHSLAITELERTWTRHAEQDGYFANAASQLLAGGQQVRECELANAAEPVEKLILTENGPGKVLIDRETGKQTNAN